MQIALFDQSTVPFGITPAVLTQIAAAVQRQFAEHYAPFWQVAPMHVFYSPSLDGLDPDVCPLVIRDQSAAEGALGDHYTASGRPIGEVLIEPLKAQGASLMTGANSLSVTVSHEALEMAGDAYISWWADLPDGGEEALELCDRVEADSYEIDGVAVSNFLGPRAFGDGPGPWDFMGLLTSPREIRPGGYQIKRAGGVTSQVWGAGYPEARKAIKAGSRRMLARR